LTVFKLLILGHNDWTFFKTDSARAWIKYRQLQQVEQLDVLCLFTNKQVLNCLCGIDTEAGCFLR